MLEDATQRTFQELAEKGQIVKRWDRGNNICHLINGSEVWFRSGESPERLRGPNLGWFWLDEAALLPLAVWNVMIGRLRQYPGRGWITTTPRGDNWVYDIFVRRHLPDYSVIRSSSRDNTFLPAPFIASLEQTYTSTFARQEIEGEFLLDVEGALWKRSTLDRDRVLTAPPLSRIVVGVDPKISAEADSETGIVVAGVGKDGHAYVLGDFSFDGLPDQWAQRVVLAYETHEADRIVAEVNQGGDMVTAVLKATGHHLPITPVRATRGKVTRAEPVAALYEQGRVHHVGVFPQLEDQLTGWIPGGRSPDRLDALVWALTSVALSNRGPLLLSGS